MRYKRPRKVVWEEVLITRFRFEIFVLILLLSV